MFLKSAILAAILALPAIATASHGEPSESVTVHYRSTVWAQSGAHIGETFALMVFDGDDSDTLDFGLSFDDCATIRAILSHDLPNVFACRVERSI